MGKDKKREKAVNAGERDRTTRVRKLQGMSSLPIVLLALASAGILLTTYLTYVASFETHPVFCNEGSGCDLVQSSRWATFLGMPMALWGCLTYIGIAGLVWRARTKPDSWTPLMFVSVCGFVISAYLTVISVVEIEATCPYCLASFAIITTIMVLTIVRQPSDWFPSLMEATVVAVLIVGALHMHYSGVFDVAAGPEDPQLRALAIHLTETGVKFYGAYWCPRCQEQKALFDASAKRLPYVECSSGGRGSPLTAPCASQNIRSYPTWIIDDQRLTGLRTTHELASASGFTWKK